MDGPGDFFGADRPSGSVATSATAPWQDPGRAPRRWPVVVAAVGAVVLVVTAVVGVHEVRELRATREAQALTPVTVPAPASEGWSATWVDAAGRPGRWDPCEPVHYVVQEAWAPPGGRADVVEALRRLTVASGLRFVDDGPTDEVPSRGRASYQPERYGDRWAPVLIAWVPPDQTDLGVGDGVQGATSSVAVPSEGGGSLVTAQVALDASNRLGPGFGPGATEGEVLLHELTHAVGLGHVDDPTQVMYTTTTNAESEFGRGDRAGLAAVGAAAGCHPAPPAGDLER